MEIKVSWDFAGRHNEAKFEDSPAGRSAANEIWAALRDLNGIANLFPIPKSAAKKSVVKVTFCDGGRQYTYLTKTKVSIGEKVVVSAADIDQIVTVVDSGEMSDAELESICPLSQFKYIVGKVVPA